MRIYHDWGFFEDGNVILPISVGMVAEDGRELYLINTDAPLQDIRNHSWLMENVVPSLPIAATEMGTLIWNALHPDYNLLRYKHTLAAEVHDFINATESLPDGPDGPDAELWGWYPAYDHVVMCQMWGPMVSRPEGVPMQTFDVHQEAMRLGNPDLALGSIGGQTILDGLPEHHALADARECKFRHEWLISYEGRLRAEMNSADHFGCPGKGKLHAVLHDGPCLP
jgi:hypothetical protein